MNGHFEGKKYDHSHFQMKYEDEYPHCRSKISMNVHIVENYTCLCFPRSIPFTDATDFIFIERDSNDSQHCLNRINMKNHKYQIIYMRSIYLNFTHKKFQ